MQGKYKRHRREQEREIPEGKETADVVTDTERLTASDLSINYSPLSLDKLTADYTTRWKGLNKNGPCPVSKYCPYNMLAESVRNMKHHDIQYLLEDKTSV